jgi:hypothetical protein
LDSQKRHEEQAAFTLLMRTTTLYAAAGPGRVTHATRSMEDRYGSTSQGRTVPAPLSSVMA